MVLWYHIGIIFKINQKRNSLLHRILVSDELIPAESITVWIDPLDATKEYTEGLKQYVTTMVGIGLFSRLPQSADFQPTFMVLGLKKVPLKKQL